MIKFLGFFFLLVLSCVFLEINGQFYNDPCNETLPCDSPLLKCFHYNPNPTIAGKCICTENAIEYTFTTPDVKTECRLPVNGNCTGLDLGGLCVPSTECSSGLPDISNSCECIDGLVAENDGNCWLDYNTTCTVPTPGDDPEVQKCSLSKGLECHDTDLLCLCDPITSNWLSEKNYCGIKLNQPCSARPDHCLTLNSECATDMPTPVCQCLPGRSENIETKMCELNFGETCTLTDACNTAELLTCTSGQCACQNGSIHSESASRCLQLVGEICTASANHCVENSSCIAEPGTGLMNHKCYCNEQYFQLENGTCAGIPLGDGSHDSYCFKETDCNAQNFLFCEKSPENPDYGLCACQVPYAFDELSGKCAVLQVGGNCTENKNCWSNANCLSGRCECRNGYMEGVNAKCLPAIEMEICSDSFPCHQTTGLECDLVGQCRCQGSSKWLEIQGKCAAIVGEQCLNQICFDQNSACNEMKFCQCKVGHLKYIDRCLPLYNQTCDPSMVEPQCHPDSDLTCSGNKCECSHPSYYFYEIESGQCVGKVGAFCDQRTCHKNSNCSTFTSRCECSEGFFNFGNSTVCTEIKCSEGSKWSEIEEKCVSFIGGFCSVNEDCLENGVCNSFNFCECKKDHQGHESSFKCLPSHYNSPCDPKIPDSCYPNGFLQCQNATNPNQGLCKCKYESHQIWDSVKLKCLSKVGGYCGPLGADNVMECSDLSQCNTVGKCECLENSQLDPNTGLCILKPICTPGEIWSDEKNKCLSLVGSKCSNTTDCISNGLCSKLKFCECSPNFAVDHENLVCKGLYEADCTDSDCHDGLFFQCNGASGKCECRFPGELIYDRIEKVCKSVAGGRCGKILGNENELKCFQNSECREDLNNLAKCQCLEGFDEASNNTCVQDIDGPSSGFKFQENYFIFALSFALIFSLNY